MFKQSCCPVSDKNSNKVYFLTIISTAHVQNFIFTWFFPCLICIFKSVGLLQVVKKLQCHSRDRTGLSLTGHGGEYIVDFLNEAENIAKQIQNYEGLHQ